MNQPHTSGCSGNRTVDGFHSRYAPPRRIVGGGWQVMPRLRNMPKVTVKVVTTATAATMGQV
ncbi:MAG: hypothetical protein KDN22_32295 [Verrucomicrobiae bacterium]|nr:hypothetical protein [Verrucomicrobiae bacterium]